MQVQLPDWVLSLTTTPSTLLAATSKGTIHSLPLDPTKWSPQSVHPQHKSTIHKILTTANDPHTAYTASEDSTVKIWDLRQPLTSPTATLTNSRNLPFFSLDVKNGKIAAGSQLKGVDSELILFDTRNLQKPLRSFIDSHNDDITVTKFHPTNSNLLLSGATDGYVNVYDLNISNEDDAMLQCITFHSIHSAHWISSNRIAVLSHMETFGIFSLASEQEINGESTKPPSDTILGDVRSKWDCEYVVDMYPPGYIVTGKNSTGELHVREFNPVSESVGNVIWSAPSQWHSGEVVRDWTTLNNVAYSAGEDCKVWATNTESSLTDSSPSFFASHVEEVEPEVDLEVQETENVVVPKVKKHRKKKKEKKHRFKPY